MDNMTRKYELTTDEENTIHEEGHTLHRIRALIDIPEKDVEAGDLGGFVETEENLSQKGLCWIDRDAMVYGDAVVKGNSYITGDSKIYEYAEVDDSYIESCRLYGQAEIYYSDLLSIDAGDMAYIQEAVSSKRDFYAFPAIDGYTISVYRGKEDNTIISFHGFYGTPDEAKNTLKFDVKKKYHESYLLAFEFGLKMLDLKRKAMPVNLFTGI